MGVIAYEAICRFIEPSPVAGEAIIWVSAIGLFVNVGTALLFIKGSKKDLNIRGAFLHMAADTGVTLEVLVAGAVILLTGWLWVDAVISLVIVVVLGSTLGLGRDAVKLSLDAVPTGADIDAIRSYLNGLDGVQEVHDLHIWPMSTTEIALTAHLVIPDGVPAPDAMLRKTCYELDDHYGIEHATLQIERGDTTNPCYLASQDVM